MAHAVQHAGFSIHKVAYSSYNVPSEDILDKA